MRTRVVATILAPRPASVRQLVHALAPCERIAVPLGKHAAAVAAAVHGLPVATLPCVLWNDGLAAEIRCAVAWALRSGADGLLLVHGEDALDVHDVCGLVREFLKSRAPIVPAADVLPAIYGVEAFAKLGQLTSSGPVLPHVTSWQLAGFAARPE